MKKLFLGILSLSAYCINAQLPEFEIYGSKLKNDNGTLQVVDVVNLTNHDGYDNQPSFTPDGKMIYFSSVRDTTQSDIYAIDLNDYSTKQITNTAESEYSPVFTNNGNSFTVVRVEKDSTQRMWEFVKNGTSQKVILPKIDSVGYYCKIDEKQFAFFMVTEPPTMIIANAKKQSAIALDKNIGRCIKRIPGENAISYIVKKSDSQWVIKKYDLDKNRISIISIIPPTSEDFIWTNDNKILMARNNQFWIYNYTSETPEWKMISEIKELTGKKIYRLALAMDGVTLAFVADE